MGGGGGKLYSLGLLHFISRLYCTGNYNFKVPSIIIPPPLFSKYTEKEHHTLFRSDAGIVYEAEAAYHQI
jgi:hypothetical protein